MQQLRINCKQVWFSNLLYFYSKLEFYPLSMNRGEDTIYVIKLRSLNYPNAITVEEVTASD